MGLYAAESGITGCLGSWYAVYRNHRFLEIEGVVIVVVSSSLAEVVVVAIVVVAARL